MSFWSRLGAMSAMAGHNAPAGVVDGLAKVMSNMDAKDYANVIGSTLGDYKKMKQGLGFAAQPALGAFGQVVDATPEPVKNVVGSGLYALNYSYDKVIRGIDTVQLQSMRGSGSDFSAKSWQDSWEKSKVASFGQITSNGFANKFEYDEVGNAEWQTYYHDTPQGQISSGAIDFVANLAFDPLNYVGVGLVGKGAKGVKAVTGLERGIKDADKAAVFGDTAEGLTGGALRQRNMVDDFLKKTDGMSVAQLAATDMFRQSSDVGVLAHAFGKANEITDPLEKAAAKRDILGAAFGNKASLDNLRAKNAVLSDELDTMMSDIDDINVTAAFAQPGTLFEDALAGANAPERLAKFDVRSAEIETALENHKRLEEVAYSKSVDTLKKGALGEKFRGSKIVATIDGGRTLGAIHVISGKRLPGAFKADADDAIEIFQDHLFRSNTMGADVKSDLLNRFVSGDAQTRRNIAQEADAKAFEAAAAKWAPGADREAVQELLKQVVGKRAAYLDNLRSRAYSAGDDVKWIPLRDEDGMNFATDKALLAAHISDDITMMDPKQIESALREVHRLNGGGWDGLLVKSQRLDRQVWEVTDTGLATFNRLWKFGALFRAAYPVRVQADSQMRLMASLGAMQYAALATEGAGNMLLSANKLRPDAWKSIVTDPKRAAAEALRNRSEKTRRIGLTPETGIEGYGKKTEWLLGNTSRADYKGVDINPARNADEYRIMQDALSEGQQTKNILLDLTNNDLRGQRATGNFRPTPGSDPNWSTDMIRALNQQYRNDPIVQRMLAGADDAALTAWLRTTPEGRTHWKDFKNIYGEMEMLLGRVRQNIDSLAPEGSSLRSALTMRQINEGDLKSQWPDWRDRPAVQGEILEREGYKGLLDKVDNVAATWYKFASDMPEQVMARHPFYTVKFREHMRNIIDRTESLDGWVNPAKIEEARKAASTLARRDMGRVLYDTTRRSNIAHTLRYISPFYSAWADTMQKWGRILGHNPAALAYAADAFSAPNAVGWVQDDEGNLIDRMGRVIDHETGKEIGSAKFLDGNLVIPMPKPIAEKFGWNEAKIRKGSFNIVFQGDPFWLPGPGVMVSAPVSEMFTHIFPEAYEGGKMGVIAHWLLPYGTNDNIVDGVLPGWIANSADVVRGQDSKDFANVYTQLYSEAVQKNRTEGLGLTEEQMMEKVQGQTRNYMILRALSSNIAPVSVQPRSRLAFYKEEFNRYQREFGADAQSQFFEDYPEFYEMSISLTSNETGLNATDESWTAVQSYRSDIARDPEYGWMYAGAANVGGDFSDAVYGAQNQQKIGPGTTETFRSKRDPLAAAKQVQVSKGWDDYRKASAQIQLELEERGLTSMNSKGAADLLEMKQAYTAFLVSSNPAWGDEFGKRDSDAVGRFLRNANEAMDKHPELAKRPDFVVLKQYQDAREQIRALLAERPSKALDNPGNADLAEMWDAYKTFLIQQDVGFEQMATRVLEKDDLSK